MKRVFVIVLDSCGIGFEPDAADFGDVGADTLRTCSQSPKFAMPNLISMGLGNLDGVDYLPKTDKPTAALARLQELSRGKDTTIGHWEIAGIVSPEPLPTFPHGFPEEVLRPFREQTGRGVLCNLPYSGTEVIKDYGREHVQTGDLIVYTSADSVFQIAAHESVVPPEQLYDDCRIARKILTGKYGVGRVIARPFEGEWPYTRTSRRHDFSLEPPAKTMLDAVVDAGQDMIAVGKIHDIFAGRGMTEFTYTSGNTDGLAKTLAYADKAFHGLCFVNLVDFDMLYGHRRNPDGYAAAAAGVRQLAARLPRKARGGRLRHHHGRPRLRPRLPQAYRPHARVYPHDRARQEDPARQPRHARRLLRHRRDRDGPAWRPVPDAGEELCCGTGLRRRKGECL